MISLIYQPKVLYNPKSEKVEFMCENRIFTFQPGEKQMLDGFVAYHALKEVNTGLLEYIPDEKGNMPVTSGNVAYEKMPWRRLVSLGADRGIFRPGIRREELVQALNDLDEQEAGGAL